MNLNDKHIKIKNEEEFNQAIKFLEDNNYRPTQGRYGSKDYEKIKIELGSTVQDHTLLITDNIYQSANHYWAHIEEFIIPNKISIKEKIINLFTDPNIIIKVSSREEFNKYIKLLIILDKFKWHSGNSYENNPEPEHIIRKIESDGYYLHKPSNGNRVSKIRDTDRLIQFRDLYNFVKDE